MTKTKETKKDWEVRFDYEFEDGYGVKSSENLKAFFKDTLSNELSEYKKKIYQIVTESAIEGGNDKDEIKGAMLYIRIRKKLKELE